MPQGSMSSVLVADEVLGSVCVAMLDWGTPPDSMSSARVADEVLGSVCVATSTVLHVSPCTRGTGLPFCLCRLKGTTLALHKSDTKRHAEFASCCLSAAACACVPSWVAMEDCQMLFMQSVPASVSALKRWRFALSPACAAFKRSHGAHVLAGAMAASMPHSRTLHCSAFMKMLYEWGQAACCTSGDKPPNNPFSMSDHQRRP